MPTVQELTRQFCSQLPKTARFDAHAVNLAWIAFDGKVEQATGYLQAMRTDWSNTSNHFDRERFAMFEADVLAVCHARASAQVEA